MQQMGFNLKEIQESLSENRYDEVCATYYLLGREFSTVSAWLMRTHPFTVTLPSSMEEDCHPMLPPRSWSHAPHSLVLIVPVRTTAPLLFPDPQERRCLPQGLSNLTYVPSNHVACLHVASVLLDGSEQ